MDQSIQSKQSNGKSIGKDKGVLKNLQYISLHVKNIQKKYQIQAHLAQIQNYKELVISKQVVQYITMHMQSLLIVMQNDKLKQKISYCQSIIKLLKLINMIDRSQLINLLKQNRIVLHRQALFVIPQSQQLIIQQTQSKHLKPTTNKKVNIQSPQKILLLQNINNLKNILRASFVNLTGLNTFFLKLIKILQEINKQKAIIVCLLYYINTFHNQSLLILSQILISNQQHLQATHYLKMVNYNQYHKRGLLTLSSLYQYLGQFHKAQFYLKEILNYQQEDLCYKQALYELANIKVNGGSFQEGRKKYKSCLKIINRQNNEERQLFYKVLLKLAYEQRATQRYDQAIQLIQAQLNSQWADQMPQKILLSCYSLLEKCYKQKGLLQKALYYLKKIYEFQKTDMQLLKQLANIYLLTNNYQYSIALCKQMLQIDANNIQAMTCLAYNQLLRENFDVCMQMIQHAKEINLKQLETSRFYKQIMVKIHGNNDFSSSFLIQYEVSQKEKAQKYLEMALNLKHIRKNSQSFIYLRQSFKLDKSNPITLGELSQCYLFDNNKQKSLQYLTKMLQLQKQSEYCLQLTIFILNAFHKYEQAQSFLNKLKDLYPDNPFYLKEYIKTQIHLSNTAMALNLIKEYLSIPENIQQGQTINFVLYIHKNGSPQQAKRLYNKIISSQKHNEVSLCRLLSIFQHKNTDLTFKIIRSLIILNPYNYSYYYRLYSIIIQQPKECIKKIDLVLIKSSVKYIHEDCDVYYMIGNLYYIERKYNQSLIYTLKSLKLGDNYNALKLVQKLYKRQKYTEQAYLTKILQIKPTNAQLHQRMASHYKTKGQTQYQIFHLQKMKAYCFNPQKALMRLIEIYKNKKQTQKYIMYICKLIEYQMYNTRLYEQIIYYYLGRQDIQRMLIYVNKMFHWCTFHHKKYQIIEIIYNKQQSSTIRDQKSKIDYMLYTYLDNKNREDKFLLSFSYKYFHFYQISLTNFIQYFLELRSILNRKCFESQSNKKLTQMILNIKIKDKDLYLKMAYLYHLLDNQKLVIGNIKKIISKRQYLQMVKQQLPQKIYLNHLLQQYKLSSQFINQLYRILWPYFKKIIQSYRTVENQIKKKEGIQVVGPLQQHRNKI